VKNVKVRKLSMPRGGGLGDGQYNIEFRRMTWGEVTSLIRALEAREALAKLAVELFQAVEAADSEGES
jgi:hypothetical protein